MCLLFLPSHLPCTQVPLDIRTRDALVWLLGLIPHHPTSPPRPVAASMMAPVKWNVRARQLQRFYHHVPHQAFRNLISSADLKLASILAPNFGEFEPDEPVWVDNWETSQRSLKGFLGRKEWRELLRRHNLLEEVDADADAATNGGRVEERELVCLAIHESGALPGHF